MTKQTGTSPRVVILTGEGTVRDMEHNTRRTRLIAEAVAEGGGTVVESVDSANALVWLSIGDAEHLNRTLDAAPGIEWVQLPWAGVETFSQSSLFRRPVIFTCAKGAYGTQVGEHAFMLMLIALRSVVRQARARRWCEVDIKGVAEQRITVLGAGGIAEQFLSLCNAAGADVTVLRRAAVPMAGAARTLPISELHTVLAETDVLVLALALTPETEGIIGKTELSLLPQGAVLVNVARGAHVDTDALTEALSEGRLAAAGLDVTEPEPLPADHPLWNLDDVLITSHCADSSEYVSTQLSRRVRDNVERFVAGKELVGVVDPAAGY